MPEPQRVYLAADFSRRHEMIDHAAELERRGHVISSQWLLKDTDISKPGVTDEQRHNWARMERDDIWNSDVFLEFTTGNLTRGGRQCEWGIALGDDTISRYVIGPMEMIFHWLADAQFDTLEDLLAEGTIL